MGGLGLLAFPPRQVQGRDRGGRDGAGAVSLNPANTGKKWEQGSGRWADAPTALRAESLPQPPRPTRRVTQQTPTTTSRCQEREALYRAPPDGQGLLESKGGLSNRKASTEGERDAEEKEEGTPQTPAAQLLLGQLAVPRC